MQSSALVWLCWDFQPSLTGNSSLSWCCFCPWLVWVFLFWRSWTRDTRRGRRRTTLPQAPWTQISVGYEREGWAHVSFNVFIYVKRHMGTSFPFTTHNSLKSLFFYEFHGTEVFFWCSNLTQAWLGMVRGVCCSSLLSGLSWEYSWCAVSRLQMYFQTQFSILFSDYKQERNWPAQMLLGFAGWRSITFPEGLMITQDAGRTSKWENSPVLVICRWLNLNMTGWKLFLVHFVPQFVPLMGLVLGKAAGPWWIRSLGVEQDVNKQNPSWCFVLGLSTHKTLSF